MDYLQMGGTGAAGSLFGALMCWFGFRDRLDRHERRLVRLEKDVIYENSCGHCKTDRIARDAELAGRLDRVDTVIDAGFADLKAEIRSMRGGR